MLVAVQVSVPGLYLPPVFKVAAAGIKLRPRRSFRCRSRPPYAQSRASGALVVLVAVQLSVLGLYLPPVLRTKLIPSCPPQTIISLPVHTALCVDSAIGRVSDARGCPGIVMA